MSPRLMLQQWRQTTFGQYPNRLPTFAPALVGLALILIGLGYLGRWTFMPLLIPAFLVVCTLLPLPGVPIVVTVALALLIVSKQSQDIGWLLQSGTILSTTAALGVALHRFLQGIEWRLASQSVLLALAEADTSATPDTTIRQTLTLLRDFTHADAAIALRQIDCVTAITIASLPARVLPEPFTTPTLFAEALEKNSCLYYPDYPSTPDAARTLLSLGTQSLAILPLAQVNQNPGAILLIWYRHTSIPVHLRHFIELLLGELRTLLQFQDTTFRLDKLQNRFSAILETISQGVVFIDDSGEQGWINKAAALQLGLIPGPIEPFILAQAMAALRMRADNSEFLTVQAAKFFAMPTADIRNWHWVFSQPQRRVLSLSSTPTQVRGVPGRLWVLDDITDQYFLQQTIVERSQELSQANQELEQAALKQALLYQQLAAVNQELESLAIKDGLTQVANRRYFDRCLEQEWKRSTRSRSPLALLLIDVDFFKRYNDTYGHQAGDECLKQIAWAISSVVQREGDLVARYGGEEFAVILPHTDAEGATLVASKIRQAIAELHLVHGSSPIGSFVTLSLGMATVVADHNTSPATLIAAADGALYQAKKTGRDRAVMFEDGMHAQALFLAQLEQDLRQAIEHQEFELYYQPLVSLTTGQIVGFEALVRWHHSKRGLISPSEFIPLAEETGSIKPLGWWILRTACHQIAEWQMRFPSYPLLTMSVNFSGQQLEQLAVSEKIEQILKETGLVGSSLKLEITESCLQESLAVSKLLNQIKALGVQLAIDDFGTGYSSLSRLHHLPIDTLKIDRSFVSLLGTDAMGTAIIQTIIMLAHTLKMDVVAEGIETVTQLEKLRSLQCEYGQGYLFSRPISAEAVLELLTSMKSACYQKLY